MPFYTFIQNNSGGSFIGPCYVIIEADSDEEANYIAESHCGVYFDGCDTEQDCPCCGDRWNRVYNYDKKEKPEIYGLDIEDGSLYNSYRSSSMIRYKDGTVKNFEIKT